MTTNNGGPAFPRPALFEPSGSLADQGWLGMSLRDWFAGQAISGILGRVEFDDLKDKTVYEEEHFARIAYSIADAMLDIRDAD